MSGRWRVSRARGATRLCSRRALTSAASTAAGLGSAVSRVVLKPWEREWAQHVGEMRDKANEKKRDAPYYDPKRMEPNLTASVASACAEMAVAKLLNKYWDGSFWTAEEHKQYRDAADVGTNTEVRRIRKRRSPLVVRARDVEHGRIMVQAYPVPEDFVVVEVIGYGFAAELWEHGRPADYDRKGTTRLVPQDRLYAL